MPAKVQRANAKYVERGLEHFRAALRERDLHLSKVRDAVARCVLERAGTFCVLDVVHALGDEIHEATVYRAMPLLEEAGLVRATMAIHGDSQSYEVVFEREPLPHLACTSCGRLVTLSADTLKLLQNQVRRRLGFEWEVGSSNLLGRCKYCRRSGRRSLYVRA